MAVRLDQILPHIVRSSPGMAQMQMVARPTARPRLPEAIVGKPIPNPLVPMGLAHASFARRFMDLILQKTKERGMETKERGMGPGPAPIQKPPSRTPDDEVFHHMEAQLGGTADWIAGWLLENCSGNPAAIQEVLGRFWAKLSAERFCAPDLMELLLMAHEETRMENENPGASPVGGLSCWPCLFVRPAALRDSKNKPWVGEEIVAGEIEAMPQGLVEPTGGQMRHDQVAVRLISIREMLAHYFRAFPQEYEGVVGQVLDLDKEERKDEFAIQRRFEQKIAQSGPWEVSLRLWQTALSRQNERRQLRLDQPQAWGAVPPELLKATDEWRLAVRWNSTTLGRRLMALAYIAEGQNNGYAPE